MLELKQKEKVLVFSLGALGYGLLEILWRGNTHWSMLLTGGTCFFSIYNLNAKMKTASLFKKCFLFSCLITTYEFIAGCIFNKMLKLKVWDYSQYPGHILGQICPLYSLLWFCLCFPLVYLCKFIKSKLFRLNDTN